MFGRLTTPVNSSVVCPRVQRFGHEDDFAYDVCMTPPFTLPQDETCIVYSFGLVGLTCSSSSSSSSSSNSSSSTPCVCVYAADEWDGIKVGQELVLMRNCVI